MDCNSDNANWRSGCVNDQGAFYQRHWESKPRYHKRQIRLFFQRHLDRYGVMLKCITTGRYLVVKQISNGFIGPAKGSHEINEDGTKEDPFVCAQRELFEETGLWIEIDDLKQGKVIVSSPEIRYAHRLYTFFLLGTLTECECYVDGKEISDYEWLTYDEICTRRRASFTSRAFLDAVKHDDTTLHIANVIPRAPPL